MVRTTRRCVVAAVSVAACLFLETYCDSIINQEKCLLPQHPQNGHYLLGGCSSHECQLPPGSILSSAALNYSCDPGYRLSGSPEVFCSKQWLSPFPECIQRCGEYMRPGSSQTVAQVNRLPWVVGIFTRLGYVSEKFVPTCFGSIISERIVVTAAHCLWKTGLAEEADKRNFRVIAGKFNSSLTEEGDGGVFHEIDHILFSPNFRGSTEYFSDNIALIVLTKKIIMNESTFPICVDFSNTFQSDLNTGKEGIVNAWGADNIDGLLHTFSLPLVNATQCEKYVHDAYLYLTYDKFCAGGIQTKILCSGDAGSGYVTRFKDGKWYLSGILSIDYQSSTSPKCPEGFKIFTRVSDHHEFILKHYNQTINVSSPTNGISSRNANICCRCSDFSFQCKNDGSCIDEKYRCNGLKECADGSDEHVDMCRQILTHTAPASSTRKPQITAMGTVLSGCMLPNLPENGNYASNIELSPGMLVPVNTVLDYTCLQGFQMEGPDIIVCKENGWNRMPPSCVPVSCPPLVSSSRNIECVLNGINVNCNSGQIKPDTIASATCKPEFEDVPSRFKYDLVCLNSGHWSRQLSSCAPKCGLANAGTGPLIANSPASKIADYPWHIGLYKETEKDLRKAVCGGSIISLRSVISAAHCFWENGEVNFTQYEIVAGKYYHDWNEYEPQRQPLKIQDVIINNKYKGPQLYFAADIAVIILKTEIIVNYAVRPVCIDFLNKYKRSFVPGKTGIVVGWGFTEKKVQSEVLRVGNLSFITPEECKERTSESFGSYLTTDHFCAGRPNNISVCRGDSGGGFAVKFDGRYYLTGVVSAGPGEDCGSFSYATFTNIYDHMNFISDNYYE